MHNSNERIEMKTRADLINAIVDKLEEQEKLVFDKRTHANMLLSESNETLQKMYSKLGGKING